MLWEHWSLGACFQLLDIGIVHRLYMPVIV